MATSNGMQIVLGVGAAVVVAGAVIWLVPAPQVGPIGVAELTSDVDAKEPVAEPVKTVTATPEGVADTAAQAPEVAAAPPVIAPSVDTFRFDPDGSLVVAGRAEPFATIDLLVGHEAVERVSAGADGSFVILTLLPFSDQSRAISIVADPDGSRISGEQTYLIAPMVAPEPLIAQVAPVADEGASGSEAIAVADQAETEPDEMVVTGAGDYVADTEQVPASDSEEIAQVETEVVTDEPNDASVDQTAMTDSDETVDVAAIDTEIAPQQETVTEEPAVTQAVTPTVLVADQDGVRIVQSAGDDVAPVVENIALDSITYDPTGEVSIAGRASGDGYVRVYLDNQPITSSRIEQDGDWRTPLPDIDTGVYTLRVDEVSEVGDVISRIETPFKREEAETVAAVMAEETVRDDFQIAVKTVQPGATLWAIAEERLGDGIMYVEVFEANRDLIKDPDLIFPGQVFRIPEIE